MQIEIIASARKHGITDDEIRSTVTYPRRAVKGVNSTLGLAVLFIGQIDNEPLIELLAQVDESGYRVFHAMYARWNVLVAAGIADEFSRDDIAVGQRR